VTNYTTDVVYDTRQLRFGEGEVFVTVVFVTKVDVTMQPSRPIPAVGLLGNDALEV